jgi:hypothetical protein
MDPNRENLSTLLLIFALTALGTLGWLVGLFIFWLLLRVFGGAPDFFSLTESFSTAVTAAAVLSAGFIAYRELNEGSYSRYIEVADRLFEELNSEENINARRWIYQHLPDDPQTGLKTIGEEGRTIIKKVLNSLDRVAFLTQKNWIPEKMIMPWMSPMVIKTWIKLEPYVNYESKRRSEPEYYRLARDLAGRCQTWQKKNNPESLSVHWLDDAL